MDQRTKLMGSLTSVERPGRYLGGEYNSSHPKNDADYRFCLLFPDVYDIGISYYGYRMLYHILNRMEGVSCEMSYLPWSDMQELMRSKQAPLFSIESGRALTEFDAIGITLQTELHYPGVVKALDLAGIPRRAIDRLSSPGMSDLPLIIGGGPCAFHPSPIAPFFDAFVIGDGEEALPEMIEIMRRDDFGKRTRWEKWLQLARIDGIYVPGLDNGEIVHKVRARVVTNLKPEYYPDKPIVPFIRGSHDRLTVEIMRGCTQGCRFCQAGMLNRPVRERPVSDIVSQIVSGIKETGWNEVGLLSLSTSDYTLLDELLAKLSDNLKGNRTSISFPSLRPSSFTEEMAKIDLGGRKSGLTFAVEAGSQRLRDVINKGLAEEELIEAIQRAYRNGWKTVKLYFMVGLPTEQMDDITEGAVLLEKLQRMTPRGRELHLSVSPFIPKPHSVFAREGFLEVDELRKRIGELYSRVHRRWVKKSWHNAETSRIEALLARGDKDLSTVIEAVADDGEGFEAWGGMFNANRWHDALKQHYPNWLSILQPIPEKHTVPWNHLKKGVSQRFYREDRKAALQAQHLPDCRTGECYKCGLTRICDQVKTSSIESQVYDGEAVLDSVSAKREDTNNVKTDVKQRYRLTFSKLSFAIYIGHQDLMTSMIRALRRAGTPLRYRQGFNPRPKVSYCQALPLGRSASDLWIEYETTKELDTDDWLERLQKVFPSGITPIALVRV
ncbi:MAG: TIGR03960 family B12-binding radical SAM protein [Candidatus Hatepunaea meridiana]|nr:TIGR03960 family B12-binding radical SAM protein [Candidatus Hatepunaea meridiana]